METEKRMVSMVEQKIKKGLMTTTVAAGILFAGTATSEAALGDQPLSLGMQNEDVKALQDVLKQTGHFTYHTSTGYYGDITKKAVQSYQKANNLTETGFADKATLAAITEKMATTTQTATSKMTEWARPTQTTTSTQTITTPSTETPNQQHSSQVSPAHSDEEQEPQDQTLPRNLPEFTFLLKVGSTGEAVRELQHQLTALDLLTAEATGYFGPATEEAVKKFQKQHNLIADGLVTTKTMQKLVEETTEKLLPVVTLPSETNSTFNVMNVIADSSELIGIPYKWGGTTSEGFDCSGFIQYVFQKNSVELPRTVAEMWEVGTEITELQVGDLVFFETYMPGPSHAGIYIGNNQFIHSSSSQGVAISDLQSNYYSTRYLGAKRYY